MNVFIILNMKDITLYYEDVFMYHIVLWNPKRLYVNWVLNQNHKFMTLDGNHKNYKENNFDSYNKLIGSYNIFKVPRIWYFLFKTLDDNSDSLDNLNCNIRKWGSILEFEEQD